MDDSLDEFYKQYHVNLIILFGVIVVIYIGIFTLFNNYSFNTPQARPWIIMIELIMWGLFILIVYMNMKYFSVFDFNFNQILFNLFGTKRTEMEIHVHRGNNDDDELYYEKDEEEKEREEQEKKEKEIEEKQMEKLKKKEMDKEKELEEEIKKEMENEDKSTVKKMCDTLNDDDEVFHIPRNTYSYDEAEKTCKLFDSRLATYDEIEEAYKKGANWCSYGWSSDQLALFPIQKSMYNELKKIPGHEHDCGRTGVNGGYMEDKDLKFGINCYGKKPYAGDDDKNYMKNHTFSFAYADEALKAQKVKNEKMKKILIAPFNKERWNED